MNYREIIFQMTLEEKAGLCSGADFWRTKAVERLQIPAVMVSDGPHGLRKQADEGDHLGLEESVVATCYPAGAGIAASFSREVAAALGDALGEEAAAEGIHTLLGPAINIKRSPLCGRNFEYLSEDPCLAGEIAASYVNAVQNRGVGTSVKHFAANNQEYQRMNVDVRVSERALREIYLAVFEDVVKKAQPWTIMCSYNRINGKYSCENFWLLNQVLRKEWGYEGIVMTDWGAMNRRCESLEAGLDLEMPSSSGVTDKEIVEAVKSGALQESVLDDTVERLLRWIDKGGKTTGTYDKEAHDVIAEKLETECAVLLKNEGLLPLKKEQKVAFIGEYAHTPRYQGGGSSHINSYKITSACEASKENKNIRYAKGFGIEQSEPSMALIDEAVEIAKAAELAVVFAGLPDSYESEGFDRKHLNLPECQNLLIEKVTEVQPNVVVVLHNGSAVTMPWLEKVKSVLELYLGGEAVGCAAVKLLYGEANPSGKLPETFPMRLEDTPSYLTFPGENREVHYGEGVFVGYRYYEAKKLPVLFPFGHGLSYTTFALGDLAVSAKELTNHETVKVTVKVTNTGGRAGKEVVQLYVAPKHETRVARPEKELKGFEKVALQPGETKEVTFELDSRAFAYYDTALSDWFVENGDYEIQVGTSSQDIALKETVTLHSDQKLPLLVDDMTTVGEVLRAGKMTPLLKEKLIATGFMQPEQAAGQGASGNEMMKSMLDGLPIHSLRSFAQCNPGELEQIIEELKK